MHCPIDLRHYMHCQSVVTCTARPESASPLTLNGERGPKKVPLRRGRHYMHCPIDLRHYMHCQSVITCTATAELASPLTLNGERGPKKVTCERGFLLFSGSTLFCSKSAVQNQTES